MKMSFKRKNKKRNHSLKLKMILVNIIIMVVAMGAAVAISGFFLQSFYTNTKQNSIKNLYSEFKEISKNDANIEKTTNITKMNSACEKAGATMIMVDSTGTAVYDYGAGKMLESRWQDMIFGDNENQRRAPKVIETNKNYTLQSTVDKFSSNKYFELYSTLDNGNYVIIRMSVESFKESISITNSFYIGLGLLILLTTTLATAITARRFAKPILKLADISTRMSNLDFNVKYEGSTNDELDILGDSMNNMSMKLEETITELKSANIELQKDIAKKEEVDEMRKEFISNVSHELKTPIALIQGYAEGLVDGINDNPEDMKYYCDVIIDEANKMNKMVRNLLDLNQLEFGNGRLSLERFDICSVINGVVNSMRMKAEKEDVNIEFSSEKPVYVWADEFQIEEVITNYLSNALNHVDKNKLIKVEIIEKNGIVRVSVFNTGKNIPEDDIENIWIKFYKVDKARTRAYGGNGIGLSIVKAIMDKHNKGYGAINHEDGVEFWFELDSK